MSLCAQDEKKVEWPHAGRKSALLIPVSWETLVPLFFPAGPLGSPSVLGLTSDRAAPLSVSKPSGQAFDSCVTLLVPLSKHLVVTSAVQLRGWSVDTHTHTIWIWKHTGLHQLTSVTCSLPKQRNRDTLIATLSVTDIKYFVVIVVIVNFQLNHFLSMQKSTFH